MKPSTSFTMHFARGTTLIALACITLGTMSPVARAADTVQSTGIPQITVSTPRVKVVGRNSDLTPIEQTTVTARVTFDPVTLTTHSGVALLKDQVRTAASRVCTDADPEDIEDDETCIRKALVGAEKQVDAAIASARKAASGT